MKSIRAMAKETLRSVKVIPVADRSDLLSVSFGLLLDTEAGEMIAQAGTEASINVTITWPRTDKEK